MRSLIRRFQQFSLRSKIILVFTVIVILLVVLLSRLSYITVKEIYLSQLAEQTTILMRMVTADLETRYLDFLTVQTDSGMVKSYYLQYFSQKMEETAFEEIFIFTGDSKLLLQSQINQQGQDYLPALILNKKEIYDLGSGDIITSPPFKSQDGNWYLWGFYRIDQKYFLGVQESASRLARVDRLAMVFGFIGLGAVLVTLIAGWFLAGMISRPVEYLVKFSQELGKGNFRAVPPGNIHGEFSTLGKALNKMALDLENQDKEKEEMLAQIAHELRNPLGGIELLAGLVREDFVKQNLDQTYISRIVEEIQLLKNRLNEYLNYSRPVQVNARWVDLPALLTELDTSLSARLQQKQLSLTYTGKTDKIWFDPVHLRQILLNLISNSIDASPPGGKIVIVSQQNEKTVILSVSDQGKGIKRENITKIFEPFFSTKEDGIGLGLAVCKKLCLENQATIYAENNSGQGCTFYIVKGAPDDTIN